MTGKILAVIASGVLASGAGATPVIYGTAFSGPHGATTLYSISPASGAAKAIGPIGFNQVRAMAFAPNGSLYGVGRNGADKLVLLRIDLINGAGTAVGPTGLDTPFRDISFRSDGSLFGYVKSSAQNSKTGLVYSIDTSTGAGRIVGSVPAPPEDSAPVAFSSDRVLYSVGQHSLATLSTANAGPITPLQFAPSLAGAQPTAAKFDSETGTLWALVGKGNGQETIATVDVKTGAVAAAAKTTVALQSIAIEPHDFLPPPGAPLPSSVIFIISGVLALFVWQWWTQRRRTSSVNSHALK